MMALMFIVNMSFTIQRLLMIIIKFNNKNNLLGEYYEYRSSHCQTDFIEAERRV
ncbi:hypothetical protein PSGL111025_09690 [Psychrobacter glaciei]